MSGFVSIYRKERVDCIVDILEFIGRLGFLRWKNDWYDNDYTYKIFIRVLFREDECVIYIESYGESIT